MRDDERRRLLEHLILAMPRRARILFQENDRQITEEIGEASAFVPPAFRVSGS